MKSKLLTLFLFLFSLSSLAYWQVPLCSKCHKPKTACICKPTPTPPPPAKCNQCGKTNCRTKNKHKVCQTCKKYDFQCRYNCKHPSAASATHENSSEGNSQLVKTFNVNGVWLKMILVKGGTFMMGSEIYEDYAEPIHSVTISKDYYIAETEVTQALWKAVMGYKSNLDSPTWEPTYGLGDNYPAYNISWEDCQKFIANLNKLTRLKFRMPTEAEWEYAARGGNKSEGYTYSGSNTLDDVAWNLLNSDYKSHPVKTKVPNELGIYDMSGNVGEWCSDWYDTYGSSATTDPQGPNKGSVRIVRGGYWLDSDNCHTAIRGNYTPSCRHYSMGFRLVLSH